MAKKKYKWSKPKRATRSRGGKKPMSKAAAKRTLKRRESWAPVQVGMTRYTKKKVKGGWEIYFSNLIRGK